MVGSEGIIVLTVGLFLYPAESQQHLLLFYTNKGAFQFICWDTSGEEKFGGCCESFFREAHCAIIMFDGTSQVTYKNVPSWQRDLEKARGDIYIVLCENKVDIKDGKVKAKYITSDEKKNLQVLLPLNSLRNVIF